MVALQAMHALFEDINVDFKFSAKEQSGSFAIYSMQIDNQLLTSSRPVVLSHDPPAQVPPKNCILLLTSGSKWKQTKHGLKIQCPKAHICIVCVWSVHGRMRVTRRPGSHERAALTSAHLQTIDDVPELGHKHDSPPFVEVRWDLQQHNSSIIYFKNVSFRVQVSQPAPAPHCLADAAFGLSKLAVARFNRDLCLLHRSVFPPIYLEVYGRIPWSKGKRPIILQKHAKKILVQDMDLVLEEEFLELMVHLLRNLPMGDIWQTEIRRRQAEYGDQEAEILHDLQVPSSPSTCS